MTIFKKIIRWIAHFLLRKRQYKPDQLQKPVTLENARSIALLYRTQASAKKRKQVQAFAKSLEEKNKSVHLLEYFEEETQANNLFATKHFSFFTKVHLNFLGLPRKSAFENFTANTYDLLICISKEDCLPLFYTAAITPAAFKVGIYNPNYTHIFDLMFDLEEQELTENFETIETYLGSMQKN